MEIVDDFGLPVASIRPEDLEEDLAPWTGLDRSVAVVRMMNPPPETWEELARRGFVRKPATLTWLARLGASEDSFLAGIPHKSRQYVHRARRRMVAEGVREVVEDRVSAEHLDPFLDLYEDRIAAMRYGVAFARRFRTTILEGPEKYFGVFLYRADELIGGCLALECPDESAIRIRWSAVTEPARRAGYPRALYCTAMQQAREKGYEWATLGDDPNLYGHLAQPGLFTFKSRMGFEAVASQDFADPGAWDEADLVLSLDKLSDPALMLEYADGTGLGTGRSARHLLRARLVVGSPVDVQQFSAEFLSGTVVGPVVGG
ncbi:GNAT family N-acetyltransferase [Streptomyces sp. NPDC050508]|uniref:GNAT family N-acetyltransferase n=1 Tax=Streptomyces sp. NPDC050508 TaxID=3155405 RepID=UPI00344A9C79